MYPNPTLLAAVAEQQIADRTTAARRAREARVAAAARPRRRPFWARRTDTPSTRHAAGWTRHVHVSSV